MQINQAIALCIGLAVFICLIMPGLTRYLVFGAILLVVADFTVQRLTYGSVQLLPFLTL